MYDKLNYSATLSLITLLKTCEKEFNWKVS